MADIKFVVEIDSAKGTAAIRELDKEVDKLSGTGKKSGSTFKETFAGMFSGMAVYDGLKRAGAAFLGILKDSIQEGAEAEANERALEAALDLTGRAVEGNKQHFLSYAQAMAKATVYTDDEIIKSQTLMLQLSNLDRNGIDKAMKGAMGLAATLGVDLSQATNTVIRAVNGHEESLGRLGIKIDTTGSKEEVQARVLEQLAGLYGRAESQADTFSGRMKQLDNAIGEAKETIGAAILNSDAFQDALKGAKEWVTKLSESSDFKLWLDTTIKLVGDAVKGIMSFARGCKDLTEWLTRQAKADRELAESQTTLNAALERMRASGADVHKELKVIEKATADAGKPTKTLAASLEELRTKAKELGISLRTDAAAQLRSFEVNLKTLTASGQLTPAAIQQITLKIIGLKQELGILNTYWAAVETHFAGGWRSMPAKVIPAIQEISIGETRLRKSNEDLTKAILKDVGLMAESYEDLADRWAASYDASIRPKHEEWGSLLESHLGYIEEYCYGANQAFEELKTNLGDAFVEIGLGHKTLLDGLEGALTGYVNQVAAQMRKMAMDAIMETSRQWIADKMSAVSSVIKSVMKLPFPTNVLLVGGAIATVTALFSKIRAFEEGGIVMRPTMGLVGEAGPEAIIPLNKTTINNYLGQGEGGKPQTIHLQVNIGEERLGDAVVKVIEDRSRLGRLKLSARAIVS